MNALRLHLVDTDAWSYVRRRGGERLWPGRVDAWTLMKRAQAKVGQQRRFFISPPTPWQYVPGLPVVSNTSAYSPLHVYYPGDLAALVAWGRDRGVVVYPEVDFPFHASVRGVGALEGRRVLPLVCERAEGTRGGGRGSGWREASSLPSLPYRSSSIPSLSWAASLPVPTPRASSSTRSSPTSGRPWPPSSLA